MSTALRILAGCALVSVAGATAASTAQNHLTTRRVAALTGAHSEAASPTYRVEISSIGGVLLTAGKPDAETTAWREFLSPTMFLPPQVLGPGDQVAVVPSTPTDFEKIDTGWSVHLTAKPRGKYVVLSGKADYVEADPVPAGYGELAGPVYTDQGDTVLTANMIKMARVQTTTTRFQIFATAGESYEVTFYRGTRAEKHRVTFTAE